VDMLSRLKTTSAAKAGTYGAGIKTRASAAVGTGWSLRKSAAAKIPQRLKPA
jgi:hypothetical protein